MKMDPTKIMDVRRSMNDPPTRHTRMMNAMISQRGRGRPVTQSTVINGISVTVSLSVPDEQRYARGRGYISEAPTLGVTLKRRMGPRGGSISSSDERMF